MTKIFLFFALLFSANTSFAVGNVPDNISNSNGQEAHLRYLHKIYDYTLMSEVKISDQSDNRKYKSVLLGSYYNFLDFFADHGALRGGLFYERRYGVRHNADWFKNDSAIWQWRDTNDRGEDNVIVDFSPKVGSTHHNGFLEYFIDGWTIELKMRLEHNFFNSQNTFHPRAALTFYWLNPEDLVPIFSVYYHYETAQVLKYKTVEEKWNYLGFLYHHSSTFQLGAFYATKWQEWNNTNEYTAITGKTYSVDGSSKVTGLTLIFKN